MSRPLLIINLNPDAQTRQGCRAIERRLARLDGAVPVRTRHWARLDHAAFERLRPRGVILGPNGTPFPAYPAHFDDFLGWVRGRRLPLLGICGGHQALALAHAAPVGPVFDVPPARQSYQGMPKLQGPTRVRLLGDPDALLDGLPDEFTVHASHVDEVKELPKGFRLLGIGDPCHIQIVRADRRPLWGVQFHPERRCEGDAGERVLRNFLRICG